MPLTELPDVIANVIPPGSAAGVDEAPNMSKGKAEETSIEDQIKQMTPGEKSKMAELIYDHILEIMDRKIKGSEN